MQLAEQQQRVEAVQQEAARAVESAGLAAMDASMQLALEAAALEHEQALDDARAEQVCVCVCFAWVYLPSAGSVLVALETNSFGLPPLLWVCRPLTPTSQALRGAARSLSTSPSHRRRCGTRWW